MEVRSCGDGIVVSITRVGSSTSGLVHGVGVPRRTIRLAVVAIDGKVDSSSPPSRPVVLQIGILGVSDTNGQGSISISGRIPGDVEGLSNLGRRRLEVRAFDEIRLEALPSPAVASQTYDYVIVGGGVTGLIVANRLTEDKKSE